MLPFPNNLYARWRRESGAIPRLHEPGEAPPERLLQSVWQHQRLRRDRLVSLDGASIQVLHPGFVSREGGPDFRGAVIRFGDGPPRSGDVEVDLHPSGWRAHGHDRNPAFANVILHVIWDGDEPARGAPVTVAIGDQLDAPIAELGVWLNAEADRPLPGNLRGQCCPALAELPVETRRDLFRDAAEVRFGSKTAQLHARARQVGWDQALWEGLFRALGYKHNTWPMHCLAENRARWLTPGASPLELQARLFGISGLLPAELTRSRSSADGYVRGIWDRWWREREEFADCLLPAGLWRFHGQRPANHPQRRLALAAHWLAAGDLTARIERWCAAPVPDNRLPESLLELLQVDLDSYWSWHWTLRSTRLTKRQPLLGQGRVTDLAVNVILPWLWVRAAEGRNAPVQRAIEHRFNAWPAAEDNAVLRLARQRLLSGAPRRALDSAAEQQGCIQIARDFCDRSDAVCHRCRFPQLVREWQRAPDAPGG